MKQTEVQSWGKNLASQDRQLPCLFHPTALPFSSCCPGWWWKLVPLPYLHSNSRVAVFKKKIWKLCLGLELTSYCHMATPSCRGGGECRQLGSPVPSWDPGWPITKRKERRMGMEQRVGGGPWENLPYYNGLPSILLTCFPSCWDVTLIKGSFLWLLPSRPIRSLCAPMLLCFFPWYSNFQTVSELICVLPLSPSPLWTFIE